MEQPYGVDTDSMELSIQSIEEEEQAAKQAERDANMAAAKAVTEQAVSYTHLTLPTKRIV